jgi:predicted aldo/keto reductase-like oxidoreductase
MQMRTLGKTGEKISMLGLGGFHLLEISKSEGKGIIDRYLDAGGNYVETAYSYGKGESEKKIGQVVKDRRNSMFLVSKCPARDRKTASELIDESLRNLNTEHVDLMLFHGVKSFEEVNEIFSEDGAVRAFEEAKEAGKIRYIGMSMHGWADTLIESIHRYPMDAVMHTFNYFDRFNFPTSESELIPLCQEKGIGIIGMKPVADGLLYRSPEQAFRYAFSLPVSTVVAGFNTMEMLEMDLKLAEDFTPMTEEEKEDLFRTALELGNYVCRLCSKCEPAPHGLPIEKIFQLEGMYDRQMRDGKVRDAAEFALRDRLRQWFGTQNVAMERYAELNVNPEHFNDCKELEKLCPYHLPIVNKLEIAHYKLTGQKEPF